MVSQTHLVAEITLPGSNEFKVKRWNFPLHSPLRFGRAEDASIHVPSLLAKDVEIEIENDFQRSQGVEIHSFSSASIQSGGEDLQFGKDAPRFVKLTATPILLRFKGVEARLSLQDSRIDVETEVRQLDEAIDNLHQRLAQEDLTEEQLARQIQAQCNELLEELVESDQFELAREFLKRQIFYDTLGSSCIFHNVDGFQVFATYLQTLFCRRLTKHFQLPLPVIVEPTYLRNRELSIAHFGLIDERGVSSVISEAELTSSSRLAGLPRMQIRFKDDRIWVHCTNEPFPFEASLPDYVEFIYRKLQKVDPIRLIDKGVIGSLATLEMKQRMNDLFQFGPLTKFFDPNMDRVTDVSIDSNGRVFVSVQGKFIALHERIYEHALEKAILKIQDESGKQFDATNPFLNSDVHGVRVACTHPTVSSTYQVTLRRKSIRSFTMDQLESTGTFPKWAKSLLLALVRSESRLIVSGGLGSGKTSMLIGLLNAFHRDLKIVSIEDTREIDLPGHHFSALHTKPGVTEQLLLESVLRSAADVIALGEIRNSQAADTMVKALNTGQIGLSTIHSNSSRDTISRLTNLLVAGQGAQLTAARQDISSAIDFVIHLERINGRRQIVELTEVSDIDERTGEILLRPILRFEDGALQMTGLLPQCIQSLCECGFEVPDGNELFQ